MLENQFIRILDPSFRAKAKAIVLPTSLWSYMPSAYTKLYVFVIGSASELALLDSEGNVLYDRELTITEESYKRIVLSDFFYYANIESPLQKGVRYYLRVRYRSSSNYYYCNDAIIFSDEKDILSILRYKCNEDALGFPFESGADGGYITMYLPIRLHSPQNVQEDKTYVKANGEVVTLYAKYYREWEGETEYLSADMHDKIVAALSCDEVYIDDKRVTKSDNYQVDWENYDLDCDGVTKIARATFKVRENTNQRNSNY